MNNEFKKSKSNNETRYTLESMTAGATGSGSIATATGSLGKVQKRGNILAQEADKKKEAPKPRNFVAKNAKMGGAGKMQDKSKTIPRKEKHKKPVAEGFNHEYDDEAGMAHSNLLTTARAVMGLLKTIKDRDNLPEWGQEKIAKAEMMLVSVWDYLQSQKEMGNDPQQGVAEGLPQTLRKVVPGHAKREIDKKMDAGKFGKTDADKDANFHRYKKIQDKLKESEQVFKVIAVDKSNYLGGKEEMTVKADSIEDLFSRLSANDWYPLEINGVEVIAGKRLKQGVAEGEKTMSRAAKGNEKYGKDGMKALAKAGRDGAGEKKLDAIRDRHDNYNEDSDPCWDSHKMVGTKKKGGKTVPNCVPKESVTEAPEDRTSYQVAKILSDRGIKYDPAQENELINAIGTVLVKELNMTPKQARYLISYDEDFVSDTLGELGSMEQSVAEVAPPGWEKTVKAMKKHDEIDNPFALAWSMKNKGYKSHKKESTDPYFESLANKLDQLKKK